LYAGEELEELPLLPLPLLEDGLEGLLGEGLEAGEDESAVAPGT